MPLGKYYCDYCDKEFQDTLAARRRHLQGLHHQRAKALWYKSLCNPQVHSHPKSFNNGVCHRFFQTGSCPDRDSCRFYHPKQNTQSRNPDGIIGDMYRVTSLGNIPPSLMPPPEGGYPPLPFLDWG
ncbi:unnamed protein product [Cuscuta campestris]|uniref:C3H1-type domain-containing protein n=1 Tax=Cuscuta campestris TaxID=132261 RepID=A0A484LU03_9ASTE|nr:unnamed protein product [Cuscuta campestris]